MAMVDIYRATGEPRYLELAKKFLDMRNLVSNGDDDNQDRIPFLQQREAMGHAVRANYLYAGAADLYLETGDQATVGAARGDLEERRREKNVHHGRLRCALRRGFARRLARSVSRLLACTRPMAAITSFRTSRLTTKPARRSATCCGTGGCSGRRARRNTSMCWKLALYNAVLSGISLDGTNYFYVNPLRQVEPLPTKLRWSRQRVPFVTSYCCPPNVLRTIAEVGGYAYSKTDDAIWINLYGSNRLSTTLGGHPLKLSQQTNYPWDGRVQITIDECPATEFSLKLRIPGWADEATIQVNGSAASAKAKPGTYAELRRIWKAGDVVELQLPMPARLIEANPLVEETRNQVAIKRGPIVYCLESPDLPKDVRVSGCLNPCGCEIIRRSTMPNF